MTEYRQFKTEDFVNDPFFKIWVFEKNTSANQFWEQWLQQNPDQSEAINSARLILLNHQMNIEPTTKKSIHNKIAIIFHKNYKTILFGFAALFVVIAGLTLYFTDRLVKNSFLPMSMSIASVPLKFSSAINSDNVPRQYSLPDGSSVIMDPGSEINYAMPFSADCREVFLTGNAYFKVVMEAARPFMVKTPDLQTITESSANFIIQTEKKRHKTSITVDSGQVIVSQRSNLFLRKLMNYFENNPQEEIELDANQEALFDKIEKILTKVQR